MRVNPCDRVSLYGIRSNRQNTLNDISKVTRIKYPINNKILEVYTAVDIDGNKIHKLYYLKDNIDNWIKSKLVYFSNNKKYKTIYSEKKGI